VNKVGLSDWAKKHQTYIKIADGERLSCKFLGYEEFVDKANDNKDKIRYFLEVDGSEKVLESQSIALAESMAEVGEGEEIIITRQGEGRQTTYTVEQKHKPED
jgi:hypothetical protein